MSETVGKEVIRPSTFYIIMRTDLDSMNPGKAMAQAAHAQGALKKAIRVKLPLQKAFLAWSEETCQEFGTTIVLGGNHATLLDVLDRAKRWYPELVCDMVFDPTYPVRDGDVTHLVPLDTCAFVFGDREIAKDLVSALDLHP